MLAARHDDDDDNRHIFSIYFLLILSNCRIDHKKYVYKKLSIMFNQIYIKEEMLPKYTYFKLHYPAPHKYNSTLEVPVV